MQFALVVVFLTVFVAASALADPSLNLEMGGNAAQVADAEPSTCKYFFSDPNKPLGERNVPALAVPADSYCGRYSPGCCSLKFAKYMNESVTAGIPVTDNCTTAFRRFMCMMCDPYDGFETVSKDGKQITFNVCDGARGFIDAMCITDPVVSQYLDKPFGAAGYMATLLTKYSGGAYQFSWGWTCPCYNCPCFMQSFSEPPTCPGGCNREGVCN